jgi:hypothetical protein
MCKCLYVMNNSKIYITLDVDFVQVMVLYIYMPFISEDGGSFSKLLYPPTSPHGVTIQ